jgi:hypothetical protein
VDLIQSLEEIAMVDEIPERDVIFKPQPILHHKKILQKPDLDISEDFPLSDDEI